MKCNTEAEGEEGKKKKGNGVWAEILGVAGRNANKPCKENTNEAIKSMFCYRTRLNICLYEY